MIFESIALNAAVIIILIVALTLDYLTKFFSYWYVRLIPYKVPVPAFGSDYERVLGVSDSAGVANHLYFKHPKDKYVGYIKSRIPELIVRDPDVIKLILNDDFNHFRNRGLCLDRSSDFSLRNNLFFAENELWNVLRPRLQSFYESEASLNSMSGRANLFKFKLPSEFKECNVRELAHELTSTLVYTYLYKEDQLTSTDRELLSKITERLRNNSLATRIRNYTMSIFPSLYMLFRMSRIENSLVQSLKSMFSRAIQRLSNTGAFVRFLQKQKEEGPMDLTPEGKLRKSRRKIVEFNDDVVASQLISLIGDGILPCSNAVAATLYELAKDPGVLADVQRELDRLQGDLREAKVLDRVINEALRLHPTYSLLHRVCVSTYKIPNTSIVIDKSVTVAIPVAAIHKDPAYYKEPERFDPNRFSAEEVRKRHPYTYLPFGAGPRSCIGERVARRWVLECVAGVLQTHTVRTCNRTPRSLTLTHGAFANTLQRDVWLEISPRRTYIYTD